ncbi:MAG: pimeloyl-CoA dehydrogenase small subunit [Gammaproteobacteria bacterium]|jgi:pimeloyl-CoA dehydrogenase small subunit|nr:pimeloyl-CoA dehydrogenase small subunit [Gammaproteobacteria bacterium]
MDFSLSEEQTLLKDSLERFIQNDYDFDTRRKVMAGEEGFSRENWKQFAELGWLAVPFAEEDGGIGGGAIELMIVMEQLGRGLVVEPYLATVILAGGALKYAGNEAQKGAYLGAIIEGSKMGALAFAEPQSRFNLADVATTAAADGDGYVLSGHKAVVLGGPSADFFVVSARTSGGPRDADGITLFLVDGDAAGLSRRDYPTVDGLRASEVTLDGVKVGADAVLGTIGGGHAVLEQVIDEATLAVGAEAVGGMEVCYKDTVEYSKQRVQFGQPIGKFQVLQHRMVDMFMEYEQAKSMMYLAAMRLDEGYGAVAKKAVSGFKVQVGKSGRFVGQQAVQLHGGMGMTEELNIGHYFKRLTMIDTTFGNVDFHLKRYGAV